MARIEIGDGYAHIVVEKITCNGFVQHHAVMADEELGAVHRLKRHNNGKIVKINGQPCKEEINGRVEITFKKHWGMNKSGNYVYSCNGSYRIYIKETK